MSQELEIDTIIANFHPQTDQQIKTSTANIYHLIHEYELWLYEKDMYDETASKKISNWRKQIIQKINLYKTKEVKGIKSQESGLEEIVTLVSRQITKADENTLGMEKSSIKLKSLNYTSKDLQKEIVKAKNMLMKKRTIMEKEVLMIKFALFIFITVCIAIVVDKLRK